MSKINKRVINWLIKYKKELNDCYESINKNSNKYLEKIYPNGYIKIKISDNIIKIKPLLND